MAASGVGARRLVPRNSCVRQGRPAAAPWRRAYRRYPFEYENIRPHMPAELGKEYAFWFGALGCYFALLGVVDILASKKLGEVGSLARPTALTSSLFATISGVVGLAVLGPSSGILLPVLGAAGLVALLTPRWRPESTE